MLPYILIEIQRVVDTEFLEGGILYCLLKKLLSHVQDSVCLDGTRKYLVSKLLQSVLAFKEVKQLYFNLKNQ